VVKFIGDEVMWVSSTAEQLAKAAMDLVDHPRAREEGLQVRAGLAFGSVLAINGDYFGNPSTWPRGSSVRRHRGRYLPHQSCTRNCRTGPRSPRTR
jgi:hypothetical protein